MGVREAWGIVGGEAPGVRDRRFDCVGAFTKSDHPMTQGLGSCTLVAPNVIVTARHNLNSCGEYGVNPCFGCFCCWDANPGNSPTYVARFRRLPDDTVAPPFEQQYEVPVQEFFFPNSGDGCGYYDVAVGILAWPVTHITPAVVDYDESYDPPNNSLYQVGRQPDFGEFVIAGWGKTELNQLPGTLLFALTNGRPSAFGKGHMAGFHDSGGAVLVPGSCGRMRLVGVIRGSYEALRCYEFPPEIRQHIPTPPECDVDISVSGLPDPIITGRVTASALFIGGGAPPAQGISGFTGSGWSPCGSGLCSGLITRGTSAGITGAANAPGKCWHTVAASCSGDGSYDMEMSNRLRLDFNIEASHSVDISGLPGGGTDPNSLTTDTLFGTPSNSEPFEASIPLNVSGPSSGIILRILASSLVRVDFGDDPPAPPAEPPGVAIDVRTVWDLYADINADGLIDGCDIEVGHAECVALERDALVGIRLASVPVGIGRHVLKVKCIVDARIRASIVECVPASVIGTPDINTQLRVEVIPDSYGIP